MCLHIKKGQPLKKTLTFGVMHISIAFLVVYAITGSMLAGGLMAFIEPSVNTTLFFLHEKLSERKKMKLAQLNKVLKENHFIKSIQFGLIHIGVAFVIGYLLTGSLAFGGLIALIEPSVNTFFLYFHEKIWNHFDNKHHHIEDKETDSAQQAS